MRMFTVPLRCVHVALQEVDDETFHHLSKLAGHPHGALEIVFPLITSAFVGHLPPAQVLLLWDRVIGFDSLLILPVMAVAVVVFRWAARVGYTIRT